MIKTTTLALLLLKYFRNFNFVAPLRTAIGMREAKEIDAFGADCSARESASQSGMSSVAVMAFWAAVSGVMVRTRLLAGRALERWKPRLPALLVCFRAALGPLIIALAAFSPTRFLLVACIGLASLTDVLDGMLARRWGVATENLRRWDTRADTFFYLCVAICILLRSPQSIESRMVLVAGLATAEVIQHVIAAAKYGRHASYHSCISKLWGLLMAAATVALLGFSVDNWFLDITIAWGILCNVQGLVMTLMLPTWNRDVPTLWHAWKLRRALACAP
ncbi:MAG TPA: CDP-alcohol phosphatidyltransferase family protein [Candidatus Limnocylindrales bacterium]|nr:CDP-alcohol phosphatidyltransferase family protein [Candidatus Limnocylindrales bacterium]